LRIGRGEGVVAGRSHCDACGRTLGVLQTLPIVSYVGLAGACAGCRARIDPVHLAGEIAGAGVVTSSFAVLDPPRAALACGLGLTLICAATVDWKTLRLPDVLTAAVGVLGLGLAALDGPAAVLAGVCAAAASLALLLGLSWAARRRRGRPGLGRGDIKLIAALALWLGLGTPWLVAGAAGLGLGLMALARPADGRLPFGPAIAAAAWVVGLTQEAGAWPTTM
jgi:leader peptidase (prepilin peptidase)/N-methyltransferase